MERLPSARGPNSIRPWNQPTACPSTSASAVASSIAVVRERFEPCTRCGEPTFDLVLGELRPEVGAFHPVEAARNAARLPAEEVVSEERRADGPTCVARGRLDPDLVEAPVAEDLPVRDAVERDAAGEAQVPLAGLVGKRTGHAQQDLVGDCLHRRGEVHVALA